MKPKLNQLSQIISKEMILDYYIVQNHSFLDTLDHFKEFGVKKTIFQKLLKYYGIKKDKKLGYENRSASYHNKTKEEKIKIVNKTKKTWSNTKRSGKISIALTNYWSNLSQDKINNIVDKRCNTKRLNNTFNTSNPEEKYYTYLITKYGVDNVIRQYKDERYPFNCDFYIPSEDLFIELNILWVHGKHPFNPLNEEDLNTLNKWKKKTIKSKFYEKAIDIWTRADVEKQKIAKLNGLNYKAIYSLD